MGFEIANYHIFHNTTQEITNINHDLAKRDAGWLLGAAHKMAEAVHADFLDWHKHMMKVDPTAMAAATAKKVKGKV